jgi:hypothetical protein
MGGGFGGARFLCVGWEGGSSISRGPLPAHSPSFCIGLLSSARVYFGKLLGASAAFKHKFGKFKTWIR